MMVNRLSRLVGDCQFRASEENEDKYIEGYFVVFNSPYWFSKTDYETISPDAFNDTLDDDIAERDKALLQSTWNGYDYDLLKKLKIKYGSFFAAFNFAKPAKDNSHCENAADSLTEKGGPGNSGNAHMKGFDKPDIYCDIGQ